MAKIINKFSKYLESIEYPTQKTSWNIAGIIKGQNAFYKFDVREMFALTRWNPCSRRQYQILKQIKWF
jgi:hypothetical protein